MIHRTLFDGLISFAFALSAGTAGLKCSTPETQIIESKERASPMTEAPWIVFSKGPTIYKQPSLDAVALGHLKEGDRIDANLQTDSETEIEWLSFRMNEKHAYVPRAYLMRPHPDNIGKTNLPFGEEVINRWWGVPLEYEPTDLAPVPEKWRYEHDRVYRLREETRDALAEMLQTAEDEGVEIRICSDYRSGERQRELYLNAVKKDGLQQRYSAPPGHSEHQLGTTVDLCDPKGEHLFSQYYDETPGGEWLEKNAGKFGFRRSYYPHNVEKTGYISEPWHWRYIGR